MGVEMTENKREKLRLMSEMGFTPVGMTWFGDKHEKVRCSTCGWTTPFYRLKLARRHRERCAAVVEVAEPTPPPTVSVFPKGPYPFYEDDPRWDGCSSYEEKRRAWVRFLVKRRSAS